MSFLFKYLTLQKSGIPPAAMEKLTTKERDEARFMALDGAAASDPARSVVSALSAGLVHQRRTRPTAVYLATIAAILCDFLRADERAKGAWSYRPFRPKAFTGERIGFRPFRMAIDEMRRDWMVDLAKGHQQWIENGPGGGPRLAAWSIATRLRPTEWLIRYMAEAGLTPQTWREHFELVEAERSLVKDPLVLRRRNVRHLGEKYRGFSMRVDLQDPRAKVLHERMDRLNRFITRHAIAPIPLRGFRRIFNNGEAPDFDWNKGGRIYVVGSGYQTMRKAERAGITIDGQPVAEIDVKGSFINILSERRGMSLDQNTDPYDIEGLPRPLVKAVVTMTLGHDRFHSRWPSEVMQTLEEELGVTLGKAYPLSKVLPLVVDKLPALRDWGTTGVSCFDLQFAESEGMLLAVERLAFDHGIASLPVHDSLIVPVCSLDVAMEVLGQAFEEVTRHRPQLTVSVSGEGRTKEGSIIPVI